MQMRRWQNGSLAIGIGADQALVIDEFHICILLKCMYEKCYLWLSNDFCVDFLAKYEVILREKKFAEIFGDSSTNFFYPAMDADFPAKHNFFMSHF